MAASVPPRTLADQLRRWSDEELVRLLTDRPDLAAPAPQDSSQLASRAATRSSVVRALDELDLLQLTVLDAVVVAGGAASPAWLAEHVNAAPRSVREALQVLRSRALLWGGDDELRVLSVVGEVLGSTVSGLGPSAATLLASYGPNRVTALAKDLGLTPTGERSTDVALVAEHLSDPKQVADLLAEVDTQAHAILERLEPDGHEGRTETLDPAVTRAEARSPVEQLLARGLLLARDDRHVVVPREVAMAMRDGRTTRRAADAVPELADAERSGELVDRAAAGAAFELVRHVELLLEHWSTSPPGALRSGGLGVRELRAAAELLGLDEATTALHVELASAAGLLAVGATEELDSAWLPTDTFDVWNAGSVADRWARLALAWLENPRLTGLVGTRENNKPVNALSADLERPWLRATRHRTLEQLAALPPGRVLATGTGVSSLVERLRWLRPRRPARRADAVGWVVEEAAVVGMVGLGGLATHGRALLHDEDPMHAAPTALQPLLPEPVDHVLLQADLTAVAPGPLEQELARNLATVADVESRGGATVYRFTATSVRRAFDAGWSAAEVHDFIAGASRTAVPQPLAYLVEDVARRFGTVRVGAASSFLRSDDESALAELLHDPRAASLRLRRLAPTVVVSDVPVDVLLPRLRELGGTPVVEAPDGTVRLARKEGHRARPPRRRPGPGAGPAAGSAAHDPRAAARAAARTSATVTAIRAGDEAAAHRPRRDEDTGAVRTTPTTAMALLREAVEAGRPVWVGYVDNHGSTVERVVDPLAVEGGRLTAFDRRSEEQRSFAIHRITAVRPLT